MRCLRDNTLTSPQVDYRKLAGLAGMGNPTSASNAWAKIKKKIAAQAAAAGATPAEGSPKADTPKSKGGASKRKGAAAGDADDEESPTKKVKTPKGKGAGKAKKEVKAGEDEEVVVKAEVSDEDPLT